MSELKLDNETYEYSELSERYQNFHRPLVKIEIDGREIDKDGMFISEVTVSTSADRRSESCIFYINNAFDPLKQEIRWVDEVLVLGKSVDVKIGYQSHVRPIFSGLISSMRIDYHSETVEVTALDRSFLMMIGTYNRSWENKKFSDIVEEFAERYSLKKEIDSTDVVYKKVKQHKETDYHFIHRLALNTNYDFFVIGTTLYFRKPLTKKQPVLTLEYGKHLSNFSIDLDITKQVSGVVVRGWNHTKKDTIEGKAMSYDKLGTNSKTGVDIMNSMGEKFIKYIPANVNSVEEAEFKAKALLNQFGMELLTAEGRCIGIPEIRAGRYIKITGLGKRFSQLFYIKSANHVLNASGYTTSFVLGGNAI